MSPPPNLLHLRQKGGLCSGLLGRLTAAVTLIIFAAENHLGEQALTFGLLLSLSSSARPLHLPPLRDHRQPQPRACARAAYVWQLSCWEERVALPAAVLGGGCALGTLAPQAGASLLQHKVQ